MKERIKRLYDTNTGTIKQTQTNTDNKGGLQSLVTSVKRKASQFTLPTTKKIKT